MSWSTAFRLPVVQPEAIDHTMEQPVRLNSNSFEREPHMNESRMTRRHVLAALSGLGIGTVAFQETLAANLAAADKISAEDIERAERIAGLKLSEKERKDVAAAVNRAAVKYKILREITLPNSVPPAISFHPAPWMAPSSEGRKTSVELTETAAPKRPKTDDELAFLPVTELAALVRSRKVTSTELTKLYLARLKKYDSVLKFVVTLTEDLALKQAKRADAEIAAGRYRGPLHGIPWGAKDLISVPGYPTTWGAPQFEDQMLETTATVVQKLEAAGTVLVAKLSLGALASPLP